MSRTKKAIHIVISGFINQGCVAIAGLILPPLIIAHYGSEINGLINSVKQLLNYFSVLSLGFGAASQIALYYPLAVGNYDKINRIMTELTAFLNKLGIVFAILIGIVAFVLPVVRQDGINKEIIFSIVLICGIGSLIEFIFLTKYRILLVADQKQYISSNIYTQGTIINTVLSAVLIELNASVLMVQCISSLAYIIRMLLMIRKVKVLYPRLNFHIKCNNRDKIVKNQKSAMLYKLADVIVTYVPMTIVMLICGYADASVYSVYNLIFSAIVMIVTVFSSGLSASFGNLVAHQDFAGLRNSFRGFNFVFRLISFFFYGCAAILIIPFISVYIRNDDGVVYLLPVIGILFTLNGIFRNIRTPYTTLIDAWGNYDENVKANLLEIILNITISLILTFKMGLVGVLIGGGISAFIRSALFLKDTNKKILKISSKEDSFFLTVNFLICIVMYVVFQGIEVQNYIEWTFESLKIAFIMGATLTGVNIVIDNKGFKQIYIRICRKRKSF